MKRRKGALPPHVMIVLFAALVSAFAIGSILGKRVEQDNLRGCRDGVAEAAKLLPHKRPSAVARACAPLVVKKPCREAFGAFADDTSPARLGALVRTCRDAYCDRLTPPPEACTAKVPTPDHAVALFSAIFRQEHGGTDDAAALGRTIAVALGAPTE
ncbi:MAG: hypothetical protein CVU56_22100 [Deltaproteobacteria bacterium HGW-Deltaproteobacteria-14]|jgi:hypothetical protein|nr:MAG: hypothetical protein CVU56_22100 [Deltaproteobacteria bacterium HGW-Deltaproteobacteria-14]